MKQLIRVLPLVFVFHFSFFIFSCEKVLDVEEPLERDLVLNAVPAAGRQAFVHFAYTRFFLDEKPIKWGEEVWISWHADDGFMLEKYSEQDENLLRLPPEAVGETPVEPAPAAAAEGDLP